MMLALAPSGHLLMISSADVAGTAKAGTSRRRIAASGLADVFGIEMAETGVVDVGTEKIQSPPPLKSGKKTTVTTPFPEPLTGSDIYAWRTLLGETQAVFAARLGITAASISQWEKKGQRRLA